MWAALPFPTTTPPDQPFQSDPMFILERAADRRECQLKSRRGRADTTGRASLLATHHPKQTRVDQSRCGCNVALCHPLPTPQSGSRGKDARKAVGTKLTAATHFLTRPLSLRSASIDSPSTNPVDQNAREAHIDASRGLSQRGGVRGREVPPSVTPSSHLVPTRQKERPVQFHLASPSPHHHSLSLRLLLLLALLPTPSHSHHTERPNLLEVSVRHKPHKQQVLLPFLAAPLFHQLRRPLVWPLLANLRDSSLRSKEQRHTHLRKHNTRHHSRQLLCTPCSFRSSCLHSTLQIRQNTTLERCGGKEGVGHPRKQTSATHPLLVGHPLPHFLLLPLLPRACFSRSTPTRTALKLVGLLHNHRIQLIADRIGSALASEEDALSGHPPLLHLSLHASLPSQHHPEKALEDVRGFVCAAPLSWFDDALVEFVALESHRV
ncbi:hypothetical protein BLNAU_21855 [Blattamonas nauphoetae]|uniref:Uncharacterized protein n=1 Tax=Blattamonas nauphoetae TaxID=2049346 RepID=A0ABQ9WUQ4_9EUKA|nr:hypothetical protein BLNAU_21855 [Blattamonas nauphoetae]